MLFKKKRTLNERKKKDDSQKFLMIIFCSRQNRSRPTFHRAAPGSRAQDWRGLQKDPRQQRLFTIEEIHRRHQDQDVPPEHAKEDRRVPASDRDSPDGRLARRTTELRHLQETEKE